MRTDFPATEALELRTLLSSASLSQGVLTIVGDATTPNNILVSRAGDSQINASINGKSQSFTISCDPIQRIVINGGAQADRLAVVNDDQIPLGIPVEMNGGAGNDTLIGGSGDDTLRGQAGNDDIDGRGGNDSIQAGDGNDLLAGGAGHDSLWGNNGKDKVSGNDGNDVLFGGNGQDAMLGGNGNDTFRGGDPHDKMDGGAGKNRFLKR